MDSSTHRAIAAQTERIRIAAARARRARLTVKRGECEVLEAEQVLRLDRETNRFTCCGFAARWSKDRTRKREAAAMQEGAAASLRLGHGPVRAAVLADAHDAPPDQQAGQALPDRGRLDAEQPGDLLSSPRPAVGEQGHDPVVEAVAPRRGLAAAGAYRAHARTAAPAAAEPPRIPTPPSGQHSPAAAPPPAAGTFGAPLPAGSVAADGGRCAHQEAAGAQMRGAAEVPRVARLGALVSCDPLAGRRR